MSMGSNDSGTQHHEITGGNLCRKTKNATKFNGVIVKHGNPFTEDEDDRYNLLTREVMNEKVNKAILSRDDTGQQMLEGFVTEHLAERCLSLWDPIQRKKLRTFKSANATTEVRAGYKLVKIREERGLLQRFIT